MLVNVVYTARLVVGGTAVSMRMRNLVMAVAPPAAATVLYHAGDWSSAQLPAAKSALLAQLLPTPFRPPVPNSTT